MEYSCSKGRRQLFISEYWSEVVRINSGVVAIPFFGIDVPSSSQSVWFFSEMSGAETDYKVECG